MGRRLCYTAVKGQHTDTHNISSVSALIYSIFYRPVYVVSVLYLVNHILLTNVYWMPMMWQALTWVLRDSREQIHKP